MNTSPLILPQSIPTLVETYRSYLQQLKDEPIIIAIDGHSSCGKSTLSKELAKTIGYRYIDTGAMYRAVTLYLLRNGINVEDIDAVRCSLEQIQISFEVVDGKNTTLLNNENIEAEIRTLKVSENVSEVARLSDVRRFLVAQQQLMGQNKGLVMDGRDIGTVVFPNAEVKIFMTADIKTRAQRRYEELKERGHDISIAEVVKNLSHRDQVDSSRMDSPLRQADDAILLDSSDLSRDQQLEKAITIIAEKI